MIFQNIRKLLRKKFENFLFYLSSAKYELKSRFSYLEFLLVDHSQKKKHHPDIYTSNNNKQNSSTNRWMTKDEIFIS